MDTGQFGDVTFISSTCIWIQVTCGLKSISWRHSHKHYLYLDTGQFGDFTVISFTCIWIQVTCGYRSICCNQVKRMTSQSSDVNRPFLDKSHLFNIINDPLVPWSDDITNHKHHLYPDTSQSGYKSLICPVEKDYLSSLFELAPFDDHLRWIEH